MKYQDPLTVYTAGPDGFSEATWKHHQDLVDFLSASNFKVLDPWALTPQHVVEKALSIPDYSERVAELHKLDRLMGRRNTRAIVAGEIIIANLDGQEVDSGTSSEVGCGYMAGDVCFGVRSDFRKSGENEGCIINLQVQYFIEASGGKIFRSQEELKANIALIRSAGLKARTRKAQLCLRKI